MSIGVTTQLTSVNTSQIVDGAVTSAKIASGAVVAASIAAGSVGTAAISSGAATSGQILQANGSGSASFVTPGMALISSATVGTATQTFTLSNIPQGYQSLRLVIKDLFSSTTFASGMKIYTNNIRTGTYGLQYVRGVSTTASASRGTRTTYLLTTGTDFLPASTNLVGTFATIDFYNYSNTTEAKYGGGVVFHQASDIEIMTNATLVGFMSSEIAAITSIVFESDSVTDLIAVGSRFDLYGVS